MSEHTNLTIEILKLITGFISENPTAIILFTLIIICRESISNFISRLTSLSYKNGDSELGMQAATPIVLDEKKENLKNAIDKPAPEEPGSEIDSKAKEENWFIEMHKAFEDGRLEDAQLSFKKYALNEIDEVKLEENKALYLYFKFSIGKENSAIHELEELARTAKNEDSKFNVLTWLSFCFTDSMQYRKNVSIWKNAASNSTSPAVISKATINLALALNEDGKPLEAKELLVEQLSIAQEEKIKFSLYSALSQIESHLNNKAISIYCKDKSLEFDPNNRDELFNSAYSASNEGFDDISISNYLRLIRIDENNSTALNNLGVCAQKADLKIKAVENYKKASDHKNTLAMANQGYLLLDAGFTDEAENIAKKSIELGDPHENIYSLITAIKNKKEDQNKKWNELSEKTLSRQKAIRLYIEQYYLGSPSSLAGNWVIKNSLTVTIEANDGMFKATWVDTHGYLTGQEYTTELSGEISGSTFSGRYTKKKPAGAPSTLLGLQVNESFNCFGYLSDDGKKLNVHPSNLKDELSLTLLKEK